MNIIYIISDINKALAFEWIAKHLNKEKFQLSFVLILQRPADLAAFLEMENISYQVYYYSSKKDLINVFWKVFKYLKKKKPDVVHCHLLYGSLIGLTAAWCVNIEKRIYTRHHSDYHQRYFPRGIKWDKWCNRMATKIIAPSAAVKEVLIDLERVHAKRIHVIQHGFDLKYFTNIENSRVEGLKQKYKINDQYPVVGVISRFTELKGIQYIIPAFHRLLQTHSNALLLLFNAQGDYEIQLREQLKQLPEKSYRLIPFENDLASVYRLFDIFIQASTDRTIEAFGQTYIEALAAGVPSVFTLSGIANDFIVDRENALVVPFKDVEAIYKALIELVNDASLRKMLIENGKSSILKKFTLSCMIEKLEETYSS